MPNIAYNILLKGYVGGLDFDRLESRAFPKGKALYQCFNLSLGDFQIQQTRYIRFCS